MKLDGVSGARWQNWQVGASGVATDAACVRLQAVRPHQEADPEVIESGVTRVVGGRAPERRWWDLAFNNVVVCAVNVKSHVGFDVE